MTEHLSHADAIVAKSLNNTNSGLASLARGAENAGIFGREHRLGTTMRAEFNEATNERIRAAILKPLAVIGNRYGATLQLPSDTWPLHISLLDLRADRSLLELPEVRGQHFTDLRESLNPEKIADLLNGLEFDFDHFVAGPVCYIGASRPPQIITLLRFIMERKGSEQGFTPKFSDQDRIMHATVARIVRQPQDTDARDGLVSDLTQLVAHVAQNPIRARIGAVDMIPNEKYADAGSIDDSR